MTPEVRIGRKWNDSGLDRGFDRASGRDYMRIFKISAASVITEKDNAVHVYFLYLRSTSAGSALRGKHTSKAFIDHLSTENVEPCRF